MYNFVSYRNILFKVGMLGRLKSVCDKWTAYYPCCINYSEYRENLGITFLSKWKWKILLKLYYLLRRYLSSGCPSVLWVLISTEHFLYQGWRYILEVYVEELQKWSTSNLVNWVLITKLLSTDTCIWWLM